MKVWLGLVVSLAPSVYGFLCKPFTSKGKDILSNPVYHATGNQIAWVEQHYTECSIFGIPGVTGTSKTFDPLYQIKFADYTEQGDDIRFSNEQAVHPHQLNGRVFQLQYMPSYWIAQVGQGPSVASEATIEYIQFFQKGYRKIATGSPRQIQVVASPSGNHIAVAKVDGQQVQVSILSSCDLKEEISFVDDQVQVNSLGHSTAEGRLQWSNDTMLRIISEEKSPTGGMMILLDHGVIRKVSNWELNEDQPIQEFKDVVLFYTNETTGKNAWIHPAPECTLGAQTSSSAYGPNGVQLRLIDSGTKVAIRKWSSEYEFNCGVAPRTEKPNTCSMSIEEKWTDCGYSCEELGPGWVPDAGETKRSCWIFWKTRKCIKIE